MDANNIADLGPVHFIMSVKLFEAANNLLEDWVTESALDSDDDRLLHLVRNDLADAFLAMTANLGSFWHNLDLFSQALGRSCAAGSQRGNASLAPGNLAPNCSELMRLVESRSSLLKPQVE